MWDSTLSKIDFVSGLYLEHFLFLIHVSKDWTVGFSCFLGFMFVSFTYLLLYTGYMVGSNNVHVNLESILWEPFCYLHCRFIPVSILHISILYCKHHSWCMVIYWHSFSSLRQNQGELMLYFLSNLWHEIWLGNEPGVNFRTLNLSWAGGI